MPTSTVGRRITNLRARLLDIRLGTGSVLLPKDISRIHLRFAPHINGGHQGARKFWRNEMVRLKYHNPAVTMTVDNKAPQTERALMSIHFAADSAKQNSGTTGAATTTRVETIDMTMSKNEQILEALVKLTKATPVEPNPEDLVELEQVREEQAKATRDSKRSLAHQVELKREKELLQQARSLV